MVARVLSPWPYRLDSISKGVGIDSLADRIAEIFDIPTSELWVPGKHRQRVRARSLLTLERP